MMKKLIEATKKIKIEETNYFAMTCQQRLAGGAGSCYDGFNTVEELENAILQATWSPVEHPDIMTGCRGYVTTDIKGGRFGLVEIEKLPDDIEIVAADPKQTGFVSMTVKGVKGEPVNETYLIVGDENGEEVIFTFHPGEPVRPSVVETNEIANGKILSKAEALAYGFKLAKIIM